MRSSHCAARNLVPTNCVPVALCNFFAQIRQPNIGSITRNQILFLVLSRSSAFFARQVGKVIGDSITALIILSVIILIGHQLLLMFVQFMNW